MTTETHNVNGTPVAAADAPPLRGLNLPPVKAHGVDEDGVLLVGDVVTEPAPQPVDAHLLPLPAATLAERVEAFRTGERDAAVPAWLSSPALFRKALAAALRDARHFGLYFTMRAPRYIGVLAWWLLRGLTLTVRRWARWAWDVDGHPLTGVVTATSDHGFVRMAAERSRRQKVRLWFSLIVGLVVPVVVHFLPEWITRAALLVAVGMLAKAGRPTGAKLLSPSVTADVKPRLTTQLIVNALCAVGITALTKALTADSTRVWRSGIAATRNGHVVHLQLPPGVVAAELVPHEDRIAAALRRPADTVIVEPLPDVTPSDLKLWIMERPVLSGPPAAWPLASRKRVSLFDDLPLGIDRIGRPYRLPLIEANVFTGGIPGSGKSAMVRVIAAAAALDPLATLTVINLKGTPDFLALQGICHRYLSGNPDTDRTIIDRALAVLAEVAEDLGRRADLLTAAARKGQAPDSKITRDLAQRVPGLRPHVVIVDEAHTLFATDEATANRAEDVLTRIVKIGRAHGVILVLATQLGDADSVPPQLLRMASVRVCLRVSDHIAMNQLLGNGASKMLGVPHGFAPGTGFVRTATGTTKVRSYYLAGGELADIAKRAHATRIAMGVLSGDAAGDGLRFDATDPTELLVDLLEVIPTTDPTGGREDSDVAWLGELETVLTERETYRGRAPGWLANELRARGVTPVPVNRRTAPSDAYPSGQRNQTGVTGRDVRTALEALTDEPSDPPTGHPSDGPSQAAHD